jgi:hypothetical protein
MHPLIIALFVALMALAVYIVVLSITDKPLPTWVSVLLGLIVLAFIGIVLYNVYLMMRNRG